MQLLFLVAAVSLITVVWYNWIGKLHHDVLSYRVHPLYIRLTIVHIYK